MSSFQGIKAAESTWPMVSVVIPVFNCERYLALAIDSVLAQNYPWLEMLVVDDGSTDRSAAIAESWGPAVRCYRQERKGPAAARNLGIDRAKGSLITFLDADDLWPAGKLDRQLLRLASNPTLDIILGTVQLVRADEAGTGLVHYDQIAHGFFLGSALVRREVFEKVGLLNPDLPFGEDVDWYLRAMEAKVKMKLFEDLALYHRRHEKNMTDEAPRTAHFLLQALKRSLDRRRSAGGSPSEKPTHLLR